MGRYADIVAGMLGQGLAYDSAGDDMDVVLGDDDEMAGADIEDILAGQFMDIVAGARHKPKKQQALKRVMAERLMKHGALVREMGPTKAREWNLGFDSETPIAAGQTRQVINRPQVVFRGERLIVPSDFAGQFLIRDIIVGNKSQFAATGAVPARAFQENAVGGRLALDTAQISQNIVLSVENIGTTDQRFVATLVGTAVD
jgi:hypothetical protein